jgi:hypothetical protein
VQVFVRREIPLHTGRPDAGAQARMCVKQLFGRDSIRRELTGSKGKGAGRWRGMRATVPSHGRRRAAIPIFQHTTLTLHILNHF